MIPCHCFGINRAIVRTAVTLIGIVIFVSNLTTQAQILPASPSPEAGHASNPIQPGDRGRVGESYAKLPLQFEPNLGQTDPAVRFLVRGSGYTLFLTGQEAVLSFGRTAREPQKLQSRSGSATVKSPLLNKSPSAVRIKLAGASSECRMAGVDQLPGQSNYFVGSDPAKWKTHIATFSKVRCEDVYPGVDLVYYGNQRQLEYDFVLRPGARLKSLRLEIAGIGDSLSPAVQINGDGDLVLGAKGEEVVFKKPTVYQTGKASVDIAQPRNSDESSKTYIKGGYILLADNQVAFQVEAYDRTKPLIIDPVLAYSTYLGGTGGQYATGIAVDASENAYVTGVTSSTDFPATAGAVQTHDGGSPIGCSAANPCGDAFVTKLSADGSTALYSTYLGGSAEDDAFGIAVDSTGAAYITGFTNSTNFPVTSAAFQKTCAGTCLGNAFVTKLSPDGSSLVYSTYLGGSDQGALTNFLDIARSIALDSTNNVYIAGGTRSTDFPVTPGAFQTVLSNQTYSGFVTKLNPTGSALVYSTFLGGSVQDFASAIAVDAAGDAYVAGGTNSADFPTTMGSFQVPFGTTADTSSFVTKLTPDGSGLVYSSLLGGQSAYGVAVDSSGAYVTGGASPFFPITVPIFGEDCGYGGFVTKLKPDGSGLVYSDQFCTSGTGYGVATSAVAVDSSGRVNVTGGTASTSYIATAGALQTAIANPCCFSDAILAKLSPDGAALIYSTYLGGELSDGGNGIALASSGDVFLTGSADSTQFPTASPLQSSLAGTLDAFVSRLSLPAISTSLYPGALAFGSQGVAFASLPSTVTLANVSASAVAVSSIAATGDFTETNNCGSMLEASAQCSVTVTFKPTAAGSRTGSLSVNAAGSAQSVALTGTGVIGPVAVVTPTELDFVNQPPSTTSPPLMVTVSNPGTADLQITGATLTGSASGAFQFAGTFCSVVTAQSSCSFGVTYLGSGPTYDALLSIQFSGGLPSPNIILNGSSTSSGSGVPFLSLGTRFAPQAVGTTSNAQTVALFNGLSTAVTLGSPAITGDFHQTNNCGATLAASAYCTFTLTFSPTALGVRQGSLQVSVSGASSPSVLYLLGAGMATPVLSPSAPSLSFGNQNLNTTSAPKALTLTNTGTGPLGIRGIGVTGDFSIDTSGTTCTLGAAVAAGSTCTLSLTFTPTASGNRTGTLTLTDSAANSPQALALSGTGVEEPVVGLSPTSLTFTGQDVGSTSSAQTVTLSNTGNAALAITSIVATANFAETNTCGASLAAGANCSISVTFHPTAGGAESGTLTISDNAAGSPQTIKLTGAGQDFTLGMASGSSSSATVSASQTAAYSLGLRQLGLFNKSVSLSCTGAPSEATCTVSPSSSAPGAASPAAITVTVTTTAPSLAGPDHRPKGPIMFDLKGVSSGLLLLGLLTLVLAVIAAARRRVQGCGVRLGLAAILAVLALAVVACGGAEVAQAVEAPLIREPHRGHIP